MECLFENLLYLLGILFFPSKKRVGSRKTVSFLLKNMGSWVNLCSLVGFYIIWETCNISGPSSLDKFFYYLIAYLEASAIILLFWEFSWLKIILHERGSYCCNSTAFYGSTISSSKIYIGRFYSRRMLLSEDTEFISI